MSTANAVAPRSPLRFIVDHNPFCLLSGLCMLVGCWLLSDALHTKAGDIPKLLVVLALLFNLGRRAIPRTNLQWGVAAVISSFVLLLAGALMSLRKNAWMKEEV